MRFRHLTPSSRIRITPYSELIDAQGATSFTSYNNTLLATSFKSVNEVYWHLRRHVQLWDVSCEKQVEIVGVDAARLVQLMTPRDLSRAEVGQCLYVPLVDDSGGLINDPIVLKLAEDRFWLSISDSDVLLWAKGLAIGFSLDVLVFEPDVCPLAVQGPKAETLMALLFGDGVSELKHFQFSFFEFKGYPLLIARSGWRKQGGFEIYLDNIELAGILWESLWQCGEPLEVQAGCPNLIERLEGGLLYYGSDFNNRDNPLEC